jgi:hypothetical protein
VLGTVCTVTLCKKGIQMLKDSPEVGLNLLITKEGQCVYPVGRVTSFSGARLEVQGGRTYDIEALKKAFNPEGLQVTFYPVVTMGPPLDGQTTRYLPNLPDEELPRPGFIDTALRAARLGLE